MLDVTRLTVLVAVARTGSVTAAARELHYAQPSVSHHLARLEAETGSRLIQRVGRGIRLTEAGRLLAERAERAERAEEILGRLAAASDELATYTGLRAGRVRLASRSAVDRGVRAVSWRVAQGVRGRGFSPEIRFTTDDYVAVQALVAAGLGVTTLPGLALSAHRDERVRSVAVPGSGRRVGVAVLGEPPDPPGTAALLTHLRAASGGT
jgi:DNA-binding transcriptional LysR family regulator